MMTDDQLEALARVTAEVQQNQEVEAAFRAGYRSGYSVGETDSRLFILHDIRATGDGLRRAENQAWVNYKAKHGERPKK